MKVPIQMILERTIDGATSIMHLDIDAAEYVCVDNNLLGDFELPPGWAERVAQQVCEIYPGWSVTSMIY